MFGYVMVNQEKLNEKENEIYRGFYCGLCHCLKDNYGRKGQMALNFDLTFVAILLTALYEVDLHQTSCFCPFHPMKKKIIYHNEAIEYACDMTLLLTYLKCEDNWLDDHSRVSLVYQKMLQDHFTKVKSRYPKKVDRIEESLSAIHQLEKNKKSGIDELCACSGIMMGEVMRFKEDEWSFLLYEMGDYLGRFIYIMDAYEDVEEDIKKNRFNPFVGIYQNENFDEQIKVMLEMMMASCSEAFEKMPILEYVNILRNILYSGVFAKYATIRKKRTGDENGRSI